MSRQSRICLLLVLALLLHGCAFPQRTEVPLPRGTLNAMELRTLFSGQTVTSKNAGDAISVTYYSRDGNLQQQRNGEVRNGRWKVKPDGRICLEIEGEDRKCRIVAREDKQYTKYVVKKKGPHQPVVSYLSFEEGNQLKP